VEKAYEAWIQMPRSDLEDAEMQKRNHDARKKMWIFDPSHRPCRRIHGGFEDKFWFLETVSFE
jgi:hypothetical protein